ncbi:hypothetical protein AX777_24190 [Sphingobium yanoikuyae]|uniref:Uncharacterized protein n=1 Tax=Sphingobium yanoikuyae TaxID=13690 RepID=A0A177JLC2_SPHYA|nr:hypothetical protein AX777_24190 [Sphingobium yanoikuyae]PZU67816.1 MAG: hypothetical protein DI554_03980 [Sphingobium sp.]
MGGFRIAFCTVMPAKAGIPLFLAPSLSKKREIPAFAEMTEWDGKRTGDFMRKNVENRTLHKVII